MAIVAKERRGLGHSNNLSSHDFYELSKARSSELLARDQATSYSDKQLFEDSSLLYFKIAHNELETIEKKLEHSQYSVRQNVL